MVEKRVHHDMDKKESYRKERKIKEVDVTNQEWGSDFIADLVKAYGFEFVTFNPGASFRGVEESIVNYNDNVPKVITTPNESLSVAIAHGYAKASGEPALCILHNVVGTLNGSMGIYNAYADRVPIVILSGTGPMRTSKRRPWIDWIHTAQWQGNLVRGYTKWDDQPVHIDGVADSITRAYRIANTPPKGPVYVVLDHEVQECHLESPIEIPNLARLGPPARMAPDPDAIERAADILIGADMPVIFVDQVGDSRDAVISLIELAETLGAPVVDKRMRRYNFPNTHKLDLSGTDIYKKADVILAIDVWDLDYCTKKEVGITHTMTDQVEGDYEIITIGTDDLDASSLVPGYYAIRETSVSMLANSELAIPILKDAINKRIGNNVEIKNRIKNRTLEMGKIHTSQRETWKSMVKEHWDENPISIPRLAQEIWEVIQDDDWVLVNGRLAYGGWPHKLWKIDEFDRYFGGDSGGGGVGYGIGAAIGGALAYSDSEKLPINLQQDGSLLQFPSALWILGHYKIPLFTVVHNNHALFNSTNHRMKLAEFRGRDSSRERALIGTGLDDPITDFAKLAESMGVSGYGPVTDPNELRPTLQKAWDEMKTGVPVLVDVISQDR
jgi:acetolactate synthase-1/2/3 large subunit